MMFGWLLVWMFTIYSSYGQQYYDSTLCSDTSAYPGTRYTCNSSTPGFSCPTFLVYRASHDFQTISTISSLFNIPPGELLSPRNNVTSSSEPLEPGREVLIPVQCSCSGGFFSANFSYTVLENTTFGNVACQVFEGLVKSVTLLEGTAISRNKEALRAGTEVVVPLKCACPDKSFSPGGLKYLVTYPIVSGDDSDLLSKKFRIPVKEIWEINNLSFKDTIYPNTTILLPLRAEPFINFSVSNSEPPSPGFLPTAPVEKPGRNLKLKKLYISGSVIGFSLLLATMVACCLYLRTLKKFRAARVQSSIRRSTATSFSGTPRSSPKSGPIARSSTNSCLSPDLLAGLKYSLCNYTAEELKKATKSFGEDAKVSESVYRGWVDNAEVLIKVVKFEGTRQIIDVHSRLNHVNIVRLQGVCYGENSSYLVFEFPANGSLRGCLSNPSVSLRWHRRTQIAFDIATGLHYLHYCTIPPYTHMNVNTKNIFLTQNWRAKLTVFAAVPSIISKESGGSVGSVGGWIAPEHLVHGSESDMADIFAFGVVLLQLLSGKDDVDGSFLRDSIMFLGGGANEGGCFEQLRNFMDPSLKEDYPLAEALCLGVLAKACVEDDPLHRPSMDDIIKILARMV